MEEERSTEKGLARPLRDLQQERPAALCRRCGAERYRWDGAACPCCNRKRTNAEDRERNMTLYEMSKEYRTQARALRDRIELLECRFPVPERERDMLEERIKLLTTMWREARDLAVLTERYYERGYRRNVRYTI